MVDPTIISGKSFQDTTQSFQEKPPGSVAQKKRVPQGAGTGAESWGYQEDFCIDAGENKKRCCLQKAGICQMHLQLGEEELRGHTKIEAIEGQLWEAWDGTSKLTRDKQLCLVGPWAVGSRRAGESGDKGGNPG